MKNSVPILQTLRSGGKFQQGNSRVGNSLRASFLASVPFCFLRIHPFLSADLLCPLKKVHPQGLSTIWWHWISSVFPWRQFPWHLPRDSGPCLASPAPTPAEFSTSRFLPSCSFTHCFPPEPARGPDQGAALLPSVQIPLDTLGSHSGLCWSPHLSFWTWSCLGTKRVLSSHQGTGFTRFCHEPASIDPRGCALTPKVNSRFTSAFLFYSKGNFSTFQSLKCDFIFL